jgi:addiction module RelE/StbE family toxin
MQLIDGDLASMPRIVGKPLEAPYKGCWSVRVGREYRAIYTINEETAQIRIVALKRRSHAYRA